MATMSDYPESIQFDDRNQPSVGSEVVCKVGGYKYRGRLVAYLGDPLGGEIAEVEIECGLTRTRIFPQTCMVY